MFLVINSGVPNKRNSPLVYLTCVVGCLVFALLVVNVYFSMLLRIGHASNAPDKLHQPDKQEESEKRVASRPVCTTKDCVEASANIIGKMDWSANPCEDMYQFSCGQHNAKETTEWFLQHSETSLNRFKDDVSKVKRFNLGCLLPLSVAATLPGFPWACLLWPAQLEASATTPSAFVWKHYHWEHLAWRDKGCARFLPDFERFPQGPPVVIISQLE